MSLRPSPSPMTIFGHKAPLTAVVGLAIILLNLVVALAGPALAPYGETQVVGGGWDPASTASWFGTDQIGRDMFTRPDLRRPHDDRHRLRHHHPVLRHRHHAGARRRRHGTLESTP